MSKSPQFVIFINNKKITGFDHFYALIYIFYAYTFIYTYIN